MLTLERVGKTYPNGVRALDNVSLSVAPGEILAIVGGSGCGKSTLLRAVSGLDTPTQGRVLLDGVTITAPHEKIGIVFQEPRLLPWLTVADNVGFGLDTCRQPSGASASRARSSASASPTRPVSGRANCPAGRRSASPSPARWCRGPEVLLLDEPFSALDAFTRADLQDHLLNLWAELKPSRPSWSSPMTSRRRSCSPTASW